MRELTGFKILTNNMSIQGPLEKHYGTTLDLVGSFMNHSCDPNAHVFFEGSQLRVRSLKLINAGDEITQTYLSYNASVMMRGELLSSEYFFTCTCKSNASVLFI